MKWWRSAPGPKHNPHAYGCTQWIGDLKPGHLSDVCPVCGPPVPVSTR